jgi:hypothetical protein
MENANQLGTGAIIDIKKQIDALATKFFSNNAKQVQDACVEFGNILKGKNTKDATDILSYVFDKKEADYFVPHYIMPFIIEALGGFEEAGKALFSAVIAGKNKNKNDMLPVLVNKFLFQYGFYDIKDKEKEKFDKIKSVCKNDDERLEVDMLLIASVKNYNAFAYVIESSRNPVKFYETALEQFPDDIATIFNALKDKKPDLVPGFVSKVIGKDYKAFMKIVSKSSKPEEQDMIAKGISQFLTNPKSSPADIKKISKDFLGASSPNKDFP